MLNSLQELGKDRIEEVLGWDISDIKNLEFLYQNSILSNSEVKIAKYGSFEVKEDYTYYKTQGGGILCMYDFDLGTLESIKSVYTKYIHNNLEDILLKISEIDIKESCILSIYIEEGEYLIDVLEKVEFEEVLKEDIDVLVVEEKKECIVPMILLLKDTCISEFVKFKGIKWGINKTPFLEVEDKEGNDFSIKTTVLDLNLSTGLEEGVELKVLKMGDLCVLDKSKGVS